MQYKPLFPVIMITMLACNSKPAEQQHTATAPVSYTIVADSTIAAGNTGTPGDKSLNLPLSCTTDFPAGTKIIVRKTEFIPSVKTVEFDISDTVKTGQQGHFNTSLSASMATGGGVDFYVLASMQDNGLQQSADKKNDTIYTRHYTCFIAGNPYAGKDDTKDKIAIPLAAGK